MPSNVPDVLDGALRRVNGAFWYDVNGGVSANLRTPGIVSPPYGS